MRILIFLSAFLGAFDAFGSPLFLSTLKKMPPDQIHFLSLYKKMKKKVHISQCARYKPSKEADISQSCLSKLGFIEGKVKEMEEAVKDLRVLECPEQPSFEEIYDLVEKAEEIKEILRYKDQAKYHDLGVRMHNIALTLQEKKCLACPKELYVP